MTLSFRPMVELSSDHIHPDDLKEIRDYFRDDCWTSGYGGGLGVVVWTGYCESELCPPRLKQTLGLARDAYKIDYLMFDSDAPHAEEFRSYEADWA